MTRRLLVLALSFGLTAAPLAVTLCQVLCAEAPSSLAQHSCHANAASASPTVTGVPHACGHSDRASDGVEGPATSPSAHVAVVPVVASTRPVLSSRPVTAAIVTRPPPGPSPPITQLRV